MRILHLLGATDDTGGILTVLRNLQETAVPGGWQHVVWVNEAYRESRRPALDYRYSWCQSHRRPRGSGMFASAGLLTTTTPESSF